MRKTKQVPIVIAVCCLFMALVPQAIAGKPDSENPDKTLSPYFMVKSDQPGTDQLPLLATSADISIAGVIADVRVTQVYKNDGKRPIEAIYVFPASTRAAVYAMKMTIGERTIVAEIREREQARQDYEDAKQAGKSASLLEQERPNVFQMNVANIMPGDEIKVEMNYTELLVPLAGVYEFLYPTVVGPRYSNKPAAGAADDDKWVATPYQHEGEKPLYDFDLNAKLSAGMPIQEITCPSHRTDIFYTDLSSASIRLAQSEHDGGNRDFILRYRLAGDKVESGLLLYEGTEESFFLMMTQPPKRVETDQITPREYVFIMDVSGSMYGYPIDISKKLLRDLLVNLRSTDMFNVLLFAGGSSVMSEQSVPATERNIDRALDVIDEQQGGGGTELLPALQRALALPRAKGTSRTVVIATDGYVDVEPEAFDLIRDNLGQANMFAFGVGTSVNRLLMEGIAHVGMGEAFVATSEGEAPEQAEKFREYIKSPVLTDVNTAFHGFDAYDVEPLTVPDVLAERPIIVFGKYRGDPTGEVLVSGITAGGKYQKTFDVGRYRPDQENSALRYLWARHRVQILSDYNNLQSDDKRVKEVTNLGLKYSLLTQYTSFIAIDSKVRNKGGNQTTIQQPLPLPEGVSNYAVGGAAGKSGARMSYAAAPAPSLGQGVVKEADEPEIQAPPAASIKLGRLSVRGGMTAKAIKAEIEARLSELVPDYVAALATQHGLKGELKVKFIIEPDGSVNRVEVLSSALNQAVEKAVLDFFKSLQFQNLPGGLVTVEIPLVFTP